MTCYASAAKHRRQFRVRLLAVHAAATVAGIASATPLGALQTGLQATPDTGRITLDGPIHEPLHPVTLADIVAVREVHEPTLSPDGRWVAFLVRQAFLDCNCYHTAIYIAASGNPGSPIKLAEDGLISNLRWSPDGGFVTYLSSRGGARQVWRLSRVGGRPEQLFGHSPGAGQGYREQALGPRDTSRVGVDEYEWSPDGCCVAFVTRPASDSGAVRLVTDAGVLYDDDRMHARDIPLKQWAEKPAELWVYDVERRRERPLWRAPSAGATSGSYAGIQGLAWAPDGKRIAISYAARISPATGLPAFDLGVIDVARGAFTVLVGTDSMYEWKQVWSPDGTRIAFASEFSSLNGSGWQSSLGIADVATGRVQYLARGQTGPSIERVWWTRHGTMLAFEATSPAGRIQSRAGVYVVSVASREVRRLTPAEDHISACGALVQARIACVRQDPNTPPDPAIVDLATGKTSAIASVNPEMRDVILGPVTELQWTNKFGVTTNGYLIRPYGYMSHKRYPLLVILYGFQGRFVTAAEWITSFPAQVFARRGFAVLLCNYPRSDGWPGDDYTRGSAVVGYGPLASIESAVSLLAGDGLVDTTRLGIMGWSYGGFLAEFALTHSTLFGAAAVGNDGDLNPGAYWASGSRAYRLLMEKVLGGPPYGPTLGNWEAFSPTLRADRVRAPVLMESSAEEAPLGLEMFAGLRRHGVPVEFVIYPNEGHVFTQPVHRLASMRRNLDWFSFWLLEREDRDPAKHGQYRRWRAMRDQLARVRSSSSLGPTSRDDPGIVGRAVSADDSTARGAI